MAESQLKQALTNAMKDAMRARDKQRLGTVRLTLAEVKRVEVDERIDPDNERITAILDKMVKQRRDSAQQYLDGGRPELAEQENAEIVVLQEFLPESLSEAELEQIVREAIAETGASDMKAMGQVMNVVRPKVMGRADMADVSKMVKAQLS